MSEMQIKFGGLVGNGAAVNVSIGFIPDYVRVVNLTDADKDTEAFLGKLGWSIPFSSGGTITIAAGDTITGATSGATAKIGQVEISSGTFAGGNAAGFFLVDYSDITGTFTSENVYVSSDTTSGVDDATVTANVTITFSTDTEVAAETSNAMITAYVGSTTYSPGFTIGSTVAEEAKRLHWVAMRGAGTGVTYV
ncbi:MAG: hypothetical protein FJX55_03570 [Alphaproteobacteria bacterium]|nr:hypothetical protein [Alphaproteobacteria bacterium]